MFQTSRYRNAQKTSYTKQCETHILLLARNANYSLRYRDVAKWTIIEAALGIVAGCLPTIWPLLKCTRPGRTPTGTNHVNDETFSHQVYIKGRSRARTGPVNSVVVDTVFTLSESSRNNPNGFEIQNYRHPWV